MSEKITFEKGSLLKLVLWGDPQISSLSPLRTTRLREACRDIAAMEEPSDALLITGDITEYGKRCEYETAADVLRECGGNEGKILCVSGNHDIRLKRYHGQLEKFRQFTRLLPDAAEPGEKSYYTVCKIKGYTFILMGSDITKLESSYIGKNQLRQLEADLASAEKGKPVFVLNHQTLKNTNGLPVTWLGKGSWRGSVGRQSDEIREIFEKFENVFFLTGHTHYGMSQYNYEDCGAFKALAAPTVGVLNHGACAENSQGFVISVLEDKVVIRGRYFGRGEYVESENPCSLITVPLKK